MGRRAQSPTPVASTARRRSASTPIASPAVQQTSVISSTSQACTSPVICRARPRRPRQHLLARVELAAVLASTRKSSSSTPSANGCRRRSSVRGGPGCRRRPSAPRTRLSGQNCERCRNCLRSQRTITSGQMCERRERVPDRSRQKAERAFPRTVPAFGPFALDGRMRSFPQTVSGSPRQFALYGRMRASLRTVSGSTGQFALDGHMRSFPRTVSGSPRQFALYGRMRASLRTVWARGDRPPRLMAERGPLCARHRACPGPFAGSLGRVRASLRTARDLYGTVHTHVVGCGHYCERNPACPSRSRTTVGVRAFSANGARGSGAAQWLDATQPRTRGRGMPRSSTGSSATWSARTPGRRWSARRPEGLVASHYPVLLDEEAEGLAL